MIGIDAYPLAWPEGWKRTKPFWRSSSRYQVDFITARNQLVRQLRLLSRRPSDIVVSSNVPVRRDGIPLANQRQPDDPGVAVYWITGKGEQRVIACDAWRTVRENIRAVGLTVEALRMLERTGASEILDRAYTGFAALPPSASDWPTVLGLPRSAVQEEIERRYRELALKAHPDRGGTHDAMAKLNGAREAALKEVRRG